MYVNLQKLEIVSWNIGQDPDPEVDIAPDPGVEFDPDSP
jgi:hypothetical protein